MQNTTKMKLAALAAAVAAASGAYVWYAAQPGGPSPVHVPQVFKPSQEATQPFWPAHVSTLADDGLADPYGIVADSKGNLIVTDGGDHNRILILAADGSRRVLAGGAEGFRDGAGAQAAFHTPSGIAIDRKGNLYVADTGNHAIRKITTEGVVTTLAGNGIAGSADGQGAQAQFNGPVGVAVDAEGVVYVADTYNDRIRRIAPDGAVSTLAGGRLPGFVDGKGVAAQFDTPTGIAVNKDGVIFVADARNEALRRVGADGTVTTLAVAPEDDRNAVLRRPVALAATHDGYLYVATNTRGRVLQVAPTGEVAALVDAERAPNPAVGFEGNVQLFGPRGIAVYGDGTVVVADAVAQRIVRLSSQPTTATAAGAAPIGAVTSATAATAATTTAATTAATVSTAGAGASAESGGTAAPAVSGAQPAPAGSTALAAAAPSGAQVHSATITSANAATLPDKTAPIGVAGGVVPGASGAARAKATAMPWPVAPQGEPHEVVGLMGEVRGSYDGESRHHFHAGLDVQAPVGSPVHVIENTKVSDPLANWAYGSVSEGINLGTVNYIHMKVGRNSKNQPLDDRFQLLKDQHGKPERIRVLRGTRFAVGDKLGTINQMAHVHIDYFQRGMLVNPLTLPFPGIVDTIDPQINSIALFDASDKRIAQKKGKPLRVDRTLGAINVVVDAFDQMDGNQARRRLGLYKLGYQILRDGKPLRGFEAPLITQTYNMLPRNREAVKVVYAPSSGITVYGSKATRFAYALNSTLLNGDAAPGLLKIADLEPGDYTLRIHAADFAGNTAKAGRDLEFTIY